MHIPDSVLSPVTSLAAGAAMVPVWTAAGAQVRRALGVRQVPLLALGAAFCFTAMLFNIPAFGGTTAHPVAGTLLAVMLGPWAAVIGISAALAIQALCFGDGGILAYGANCFCMAFVLPVIGYGVYRALAVRLAPQSRARAFCAGVGAYAGITAAAAVVGLLLGIQPALFHDAAGQALYFPFGLRITLPAMLSAHLAIAGPAEAIVTALAVRYLIAAGIPLYSSSRQDRSAPGLSGTQRRRTEGLWIGLLACVALSPLGLLARGEAWGEWDAAGVSAQIQAREGRAYLPRGMARAEEHSHKGIRGLSGYAVERGWRGYLTAAITGAGAILILLLGAGRLLAGKDEARDIPPPGGSGDAGGEDSSAQSPVRDGGIPEWLCTPAPPLEQADDHRPANRFVERTLADLTAAAVSTMQTEQWGRGRGGLQQIDPRAQAIGFLGLLLLTACTHRVTVLLTLYALSLALARASGVPCALLLRRTWLSASLFAGALALPALFHFATPGRPLLVLSTHPYLAVTAPGAHVAALLLLRTATAVSFGTLWILASGWSRLLAALRALHAPRLFVSVLGMTHRYLLLLSRTAEEMFVARRSRMVGRATNAAGRRFVSVGIGTLFRKSLALAEEVHAAMLARGFSGQVQFLTRLRWRVRDTLWIAAILCAIVMGIGAQGIPGLP